MVLADYRISLTVEQGYQAPEEKELHEAECDINNEKLNYQFCC